MRAGWCSSWRPRSSRRGCRSLTRGRSWSRSSRRTRTGGGCSILSTRHLIEDRESGATLEAREATPGSLHGPAPVLIIGDEPAQWQATQRDRMFSALRTSVWARCRARGRCSSARGRRTANHWFAKLLDCGAGLPTRRTRTATRSTRAQWRAANPSLAHFPELLATYREEAEDAAADPSLLPGFKALRLNQGGADVEEAVLIEAEAWARAEVDILPEAARPVRAGVRSERAVTAMAAAACLLAGDGQARSAGSVSCGAGPGRTRPGGRCRLRQDARGRRPAHPGGRTDERVVPTWRLLVAGSVDDGGGGRCGSWRTITNSVS